MRLGWNCMKLTALVSILGLAIWTIGCGESTPTPPSVSPAKTNGQEAGSTKGGGTDVPAAEGDSGAAKPEADKPAEDKKDEPKTDDAKKDDAPAENKDENKKE